jgi:hypothetical protein
MSWSVAVPSGRQSNEREDEKAMQTVMGMMAGMWTVHENLKMAMRDSECG